METLFQIFLKSIRIIENGRIEEGEEGVNMLSVALVYPRPGVTSLNSFRPISLQDEKPLDYSREDFRDRLLLKEYIAGEAALEVEVTAIERPGKLEKGILKLIGAALPKAVGAIPGIGSLAKTAVATATKSLMQITEPKEKIAILGRGVFPLTAATPGGEFRLQLTVPEEITLQKVQFNQAGDQIKMQKKLKKGFTNAEVVFEIKKEGGAVAS